MIKYLELVRGRGMRKDVVANAKAFEPMHKDAYYPKVSVSDSGERLDIADVLKYPMRMAIVMKQPNRPETKTIYLDPLDSDFGYLIETVIQQKVTQ